MAAFAAGLEGLLTKRNHERMSPDKGLRLRSPRDQGLQDNPRVVGSRPAEPEEVRDFIPTSEALFEIGKPGSPYENGIKDIDTAQKLAEALGTPSRSSITSSALATSWKKTWLGRQAVYTPSTSRLR